MTTAGKLSPGHQIYEVARDGDTAKVSTLLSRQGAQSFINYQDDGFTPAYIVAERGHESDTKQLLTSHCNVNLQATNGLTPLHAADTNASVARWRRAAGPPSPRA